MNTKLAALLRELETFGAEHDAHAPDRAARLLNIPRATGEFLLWLARALEARRILEVGTSNGYSTLWLAYAAQAFSGSVVTLECVPTKAAMAHENFERVSLTPWIRQHIGDAAEILKQQADHSFGLIFLDADRRQYVALWDDLQRVLALGGVIVVDNAVSHADDLAEFFARVQATPGYLTSLVPVGKGAGLILKET